MDPKTVFAIFDRIRDEAIMDEIRSRGKSIAVIKVEIVTKLFNDNLEMREETKTILMRSNDRITVSGNSILLYRISSDFNDDPPYFIEGFRYIQAIRIVR